MDGESYHGPVHILAHAPLETMPLYVRAGAIIPMQPVMQYVDERPLNQLRLRIWHGASEFTLYEDDGHTFEFQKGAFATTNYRVFANAEHTILEIEERQGEWIPPSREVIVELVGVGKQQFQDDGKPRTLKF